MCCRASRSKSVCTAGTLPLRAMPVEVHIHHLRRKLGSGSILTMRGVGYFIPQEAA